MSIQSRLILFSFVLIYSTCTSQSFRNYGIKAGLVSATQTWKTTIEFSEFPLLEARPGFDIGFFVEWSNMPILSFVTEAHYVQKGVTEGTGNSVIARPRADYFSVPILAKARLSSRPFTDSQITPYLIAGPRVDFLIHASADKHYFYFGEYKNIDYGATFGAGIECGNIASFRIDMEFQYGLNFTDSFTDKYTRVRNHAWELLLVVGM